MHVCVCVCCENVHRTLIILLLNSNLLSPHQPEKLFADHALDFYCPPVQSFHNSTENFRVHASVIFSRLWRPKATSHGMLSQTFGNTSFSLSGQQTPPCLPTFTSVHSPPSTSVWHKCHCNHKLGVKQVHLIHCICSKLIRPTPQLFSIHTHTPTQTDTSHFNLGGVCMWQGYQKLKPAALKMCS